MASGDPENDRAVDPQEILDEAQRRMAARAEPTITTAQRERAARLNRGVYWLARHWVGIFNVAIALYVGGAILAPVLMHLGLPRLASALYAFYGPFCHQYPFRSWFLFGDAVIHPLHEPVSILQMNALTKVVGNAEMGYKMALCQRDIALYAAMVGGGMVYGIARRRFEIPALPLWLYFTFGILPIALDGGIQWISYALWEFVPGLLAQPFETVPVMRALTGSLFGLGVIGVGYPYINEYFEDVLRVQAAKYDWAN